MAQDMGFNISTYSYYDNKNIQLDFKGMCEDLNKIKVPTGVVLQPCGHNPTGVDLNFDQWDVILGILNSKPYLFPIIDMA
mmetsp:Transcript_25170/g.21099  ORF Transcript_25170/g.21099 Transcript_25170/m.21099 type:complete len:80 (-) Transcript_25170:648-887(-)